ncbi:hypothetical protein K438DRAFT_1998523 [Mycena galopus ATCC 62051]|nr:hypothetical protein K438DRAFT_1998523 [Mycena galopus ATCC 62051]
MTQNMIQPALLFDALKDNMRNRETRPRNVYTPQVTDAILENKVFTRYARFRICVKAGLSQRAPEHYKVPAYIKRTIVPLPPQPEVTLRLHSLDHD